MAHLEILTLPSIRCVATDLQLQFFHAVVLGCKAAGYELQHSLLGYNLVPLTGGELLEVHRTTMAI